MRIYITPSFTRWPISLSIRFHHNNKITSLFLSSPPFFYPAISWLAKITSNINPHNRSEIIKKRVQQPSAMCMCLLLKNHIHRGFFVKSFPTPTRRGKSCDLKTTTLADCARPTTRHPNSYSRRARNARTLCLTPNTHTTPTHTLSADL